MTESIDPLIRGFTQGGYPGLSCLSPSEMNSLQTSFNDATPLTLLDANASDSPVPDSVNRTLLAEHDLCGAGLHQRKPPSVTGRERIA